MKEKVRILLSGVGNRALPKDPAKSNWMGWVEQILRSGDFTLAAAHDLQDTTLNRLLEKGILGEGEVFCDFDKMLSEVEAGAILICSPAESHASAIRKALGKNLHVLVEKPFVNDLEDGKRLIKEIEQKNLVVSVVQNWRYKDVGRLLKQHIREGLIGEVNHVFFRYIRNRENPNYPKYIFKEEYPLLYAMGIHHLDLMRYVLGDEFESVHATSFKPRGSLYDSDTGMNIFLKTKKGVPVVYSGTFSSKNNFLPQESLLVEGNKGSLFNESEWSEPPLWLLPEGKKERIDLSRDVRQAGVVQQYDHSDARILKNFYLSMLGEEKPLCEASDALRSIALLEACRISCEAGRTITIKEVLSIK